MRQKQQIDQIILNAFAEDMHNGDVTADTLLKDTDRAHGFLIAKEDGVIAGLEVFSRVFDLLDGEVNITFKKNDGDMVKNKDIIGEIEGVASTILKGERTALNILQRMSGTASMTKIMVDQVKGTQTRVVDTRKTAPNLRILDKWAVVLGGGHNHRYNLSDAVMIKDNHIKAVGSITEAVKRARAGIPHTMTIEVETETFDMVKEAVEAGADIIMLDNMTNKEMKEAVAYIDGRAVTEASGNITVETIGGVARTGVDVISSGAMTHSVKALDISLKFD